MHPLRLIDVSIDTSEAVVTISIHLGIRAVSRAIAANLSTGMTSKTNITSITGIIPYTQYSTHDRPCQCRTLCRRPDVLTVAIDISTRQSQVYALIL